MAASNGVNPRENWHPARLIPTVGIKGQEEQDDERHRRCWRSCARCPSSATRCSRSSAPRSRRDRDLRRGALQGRRRQDRHPRRRDRLRARQEAMGASSRSRPAAASATNRSAAISMSHERTALTASSRSPTRSLRHRPRSPVTVDGRKLDERRSGTSPGGGSSRRRSSSTATAESRPRPGVDPRRAHRLHGHPASGAGGFEDMGDKWVSVRKAAHDGTLRRTCPRPGPLPSGGRVHAVPLSRPVAGPRPTRLHLHGRASRPRQQLSTSSSRRSPTTGALDAVLRVPGRDRRRPDLAPTCVRAAR